MQTLKNVFGNSNLNFDFYVNKLCKKASENLYAFARIAKYMDINKWRMLMKAFLSWQFSELPPNAPNVGVPQ